MKELEFKAQLAHDGSVTKKISDFHNVKELYKKLADAFEIQRDQVRQIYLLCSVSVTKPCFKKIQACMYNLYVLYIYNYLYKLLISMHASTEL